MLHHVTGFLRSHHKKWDDIICVSSVTKRFQFAFVLTGCQCVDHNIEIHYYFQMKHSLNNLSNMSDLLWTIFTLSIQAWEFSCLLPWFQSFFLPLQNYGEFFVYFHAFLSIFRLFHQFSSFSSFSGFFMSLCIY